MRGMDYSICAFETGRLRVAEWHSLWPGDCRSSGLARFVQELLTESTTASLPPEWRGPYTLDRACAWIADRDSESFVLLAVARDTTAATGIVILSRPERQAPSGADVHLGYVIAERYQGRGLATELLNGLVEWSRARTGGFLSAGVSSSNPASIRVLEKAGFQKVASRDSESTELFYRLKLG